jgi:hypothetical protein
MWGDEERQYHKFQDELSRKEYSELVSDFPKWVEKMVISTTQKDRIRIEKEKGIL